MVRVPDRRNGCTYTSSRPDSFEAYTSHRPSGDTEALRSLYRDSGVIRLGAESARVIATARRVPSGDSRGSPKTPDSASAGRGVPLRSSHTTLDLFNAAPSM